MSLGGSSEWRKTAGTKGGLVLNGPELRKDPFCFLRWYIFHKSWSSEREVCSKPGPCVCARARAYDLFKIHHPVGACDREYRKWCRHEQQPIRWIIAIDFPLMFMGVQTRISCFKGLILFSYISVCSEFVSVFLSATLRLRNCTGKEQVVQEGCSEVSTQLWCLPTVLPFICWRLPDISSCNCDDGDVIIIIIIVTTARFEPRHSLEASASCLCPLQLFSNLCPLTSWRHPSPRRPILTLACPFTFFPSTTATRTLLAGFCSSSRITNHHHHCSFISI